MNVMTIEDSGETSVISLTVDSKLIRLEKSSNWRYTECSQKARYVSDTFFNYVSDLQDKTLVWGRTSEDD